MRWIPFVMVRLTAVFAAGVLVGIHFPGISRSPAVTVSLMFLALVYLMVWLLLRKQPVIRIITGLTGLIFLFLAGLIVVFFRNESHRPDSLSLCGDTIQAYRVRIISPIEKRKMSWRCRAQAEATRSNFGWNPASGKLILSWPLTERVDTLHYGDHLLIQGSPQLVQGPFNPGEFNYKAYLSRQQLYHQHFIRAGQWAFVSETADRNLIYYATETRRWTLQVIGELVHDERAQATLSAFVIGVTEGIDDDLRQAYASGGAMHALAVSGMHVSILYGVLLFLLKPIESRRAGPWTIALISLLVLWMYGFVTGLTPSVLRAVAMFSFVALAKPLGRTTSIINTLAASAFFLLIFDPWLILSAGFQLSYLAVLGIVLLYRPFYNLLEMPWAWADWIWQITCVSIAAQLGTLPVTLYYFHQFPLYFLLANLFVIPASTIILLGGIMMVITSSAPLLADWLARGLEWLIWLLNEGLFAIARLPMSVIGPIHLTIVQAACLAALVAGGYCLFRTKRFHWLSFAFVAALVFAFEDWNFNRSATGRFIVHRVSGHTSLEWQQGFQSMAFQDSALQRQKRISDNHILPGRLSGRIVSVEILDTKPRKGVECLVFQGRHHLRVTSPDFLPADSLYVEFLIIGDNGAPPIETLCRTLTFDHLILDGSNSPAYARRVVAEASRMGIACWSVLESGAFVFEYNLND